MSEARKRELINYHGYMGKVFYDCEVCVEEYNHDLRMFKDGIRRLTDLILDEDEIDYLFKKMHADWADMDARYFKEAVINHLKDYWKTKGLIP
jgi:hypothetical protein